MKTDTRKKATEYLKSKDSRYSVLSKVTNTALSGAALVGIPGAKKRLHSRAMKYAMKKTAQGASGVIAAKTGVDKQSVNQLMSGAGKMTGVTKGIHNELTGKSSAVGRMGAKAAGKVISLVNQRRNGSGPTPTVVEEAS